MEVEKPIDQITVYFLSTFFLGLLLIGLASVIFSYEAISAIYRNLAGLGLAAVFLQLTKITMPRCPNCGKGIYSVLELKGYPLIIKSWSGKACGGCGAKFKT